MSSQQDEQGKYSVSMIFSYTYLTRAEFVMPIVAEIQ